MSDRAEFGGWINHVHGWREEYIRSKEDRQIFWISYEQLTTDPERAIAEVAAFLEVDTTNDPNLVLRVAEGCKFENVKKSAELAIASGVKGDAAHLRKGQIGDWRNHFTDQLRSEFEHELNNEGSFQDMGLEYDIGESERMILGGGVDLDKKAVEPLRGLIINQ